MQSDDPPFLCLGTEVSAKFKGAFCEAKVKKLVKSIKCKVNLGSEHGTVVVEDKDIKGTIVLNGNVDVTQGKNIRAGVIQHIKDCSQYTVVFNDGDERNLRRTQVCLKSGRHFEPEVSLDSLPLYNPEHFSNPVVHGNKKRNRQVSVERTPRKRKAKDDDEEEEEEAEKRKKRRAANVAVAAMADQGESTEEEREEAVESGEESEEEKEKDKSEKKKKVEKVKTPEASPAKKRKEEREEEKRKREKEKEEEKKRKEKEDKKKEKDEVKKKDKKEKEEEKRKDEDKKKEKKDKKEKEVEKEEKKSKEEKTEKVKGKDASPKKDKDKEKEKDKSESSSTATSAKDRATIEEEIKKPGVAVVVAVHKESKSIYYPALTASLDAYKKYASSGSIKPVAETQLIVKSLCTDAYVRVNLANCVLFESFDTAEFFKEKMGSKAKAAIGLASAWSQKKRLPKEWSMAEVFGDEEAKRIEKEKAKKLREEEKRKEKEEEKKKEEERKKKEEEDKKREEEEEERKEKEEQEKKRKDKEEEKKEREREKEKEREKKEKEKEKKAKKQAEPQTSSSESEESSEDDEADLQERDIFTAQLYKFHEERNTPINKAPVWGGKDLDLHKLYRYVSRYGGSKKCTDSGLWKKILVKLKLSGTGAQPMSLKKAYTRYLNEFHSTYSQLGWSLQDLSTKIVSGGRSAKKVIDYGFRKKRRERKDKGQLKLGDKDSSIRSGETAEIEEEREGTVKKEDEESLRPFDASSNETHSRRSLSRITNSESPMPSTSTLVTPAKRGTRKGKGSKEESVVRTMSECTEPALTPVVGEDALSTVSSSLAPPFPPSSFSPSLEGTSWAHEEAKDDYLPANILTHFYQGMSVKALHSGQWYSARVVQVHQPSIKAVTDAIDRAAGGKVKPEPGEAFGLSSLDELREMSKKIRCLVHYLGWNSRYDEYMRLPQIRISQRDDDASIRLAKPKLSENLLSWVAKWSRTREGMSALCGPLDSPKDSSSSMGGMGGYRPRRVSFSQYEQLSTCGTSPMGGAVSPSLSERERRERRSEEAGEKMKSEEREEEMEMEGQEEEEEKEIRKSVTPVPPVVEKKEKRKVSKKEEKERKEEEKVEERDEKDEKDKHLEKKDKKEKEESKSKRTKAPTRTPSPSKLSSLPPSSSVDAAPAASPVPPAADATAAATPSISLVAAARPSTPAAAAAEEKEAGKKGCSISDTIDEVVLLLGSRAEKEKKEREERERREKKEAEKMRKEEEAAAALVAKVAAKQKYDEEMAGPSKEAEEDETVTVDAVRIAEEDKTRKEVRFEKIERKKGGKDREPEVKGKKKTHKEDEKEKKKGGKRVEKKKEEEEDEAMEDEEAEFERLHEEAKALGVPLPDLAKESSESPGKMEEGEKRKEGEKEKAAREDNDEKYQSDSSAKTISTTIDKSAPPSTGKGKKRKKKGNQSNMVLDRKYAKKSKKDEEDDSEQEDAVLSERPPHATLSVLKSRMLKAMEADGSLRDFSPIGLPHITHSNLYGEKVVCNWSQLEKHAEELREYYYGVRAELAKLEKRNKATIKRRIEKDRAEREVRKAAKEAAAAASPTTSAAAAATVAALNAEI